MLDTVERWCWPSRGGGRCCFRLSTSIPESVTASKLSGGRNEAGRWFERPAGFLLSAELVGWLEFKEGDWEVSFFLLDQV